MTTHHRPILPGDALENPVTGERFTFTETAASTGGELLAFDFALGPGGAVPIPHVHPIERMLAEVVALAHAGRLTRRGLPRDPRELARLARAYDREAHAPLLSVGLQRLLLAPLVRAAPKPPSSAASAASASARTSRWSSGLRAPSRIRPRA